MMNKHERMDAKTKRKHNITDRPWPWNRARAHNWCWKWDLLTRTTVVIQTRAASLSGFGKKKLNTHTSRSVFLLAFDLSYHLISHLLVGHLNPYNINIHWSTEQIDKQIRQCSVSCCEIIFHTEPVTGFYYVILYISTSILLLMRVRESHAMPALAQQMQVDQGMANISRTRSSVTVAVLQRLVISSVTVLPVTYRSKCPIALWDTHFSLGCQMATLVAGLFKVMVFIVINFRNSLKSNRCNVLN